MPEASTPGTGPSSPPARPGSVQRLRLFAICLGLALATFAQNAGSVAADTKLDLLVDPARFLRRSLSLWDPIGSAGQLQDQAYGYLFPMGPFFALGKLLALPPWMIQRCWESLVLIVAFLGMVRLARLLGIGGFWPRVAAGLGYTLAPRMLSELFAISAELLPVAALPWVLVPLVRAAADERQSPRRAAARSGLALLLAGGINAAATLAILPAPALFLLTRARGRRRASLIRWWLLAVLLSGLWWLIPLLLLGRYSPPFLDWIESAAVTTTPTSLTASLRGVTHWLAYLGPGGWPAGWVLVVAPAAVLTTCLVAGLGLAGIGLPRFGSAERNRLFLVGCLLLGLVLVTLGHRGSLGPPFPGQWQRLLDGPANAFRNVHKFDPLVRLPLAVGLGQLVGWFDPGRLRRWRLPDNSAWLPALALLAIGAVAAGPVFGGRMVGQPRPVADQAWWTQAADWLAAHADNGRALVVPGAGRPNLIWGQTVDDPLQPVAHSRWSVRDGLPLTQPGYIRFLDAVDAILARGRGDDTLQVLLARAGVRYLVLRNDLDSAAAGSVPLSDVHATVDNSAGLRQVAGFGPPFGGDTSGVAELTDGGAWPRSAAVQIYSVADYAGPIGLLPATGAVAATGSSDALVSLAERGLTVDQPVLLGPASPASPGFPAPASTVATDGIRRREIVFGDATSYPATLDASTPFELPRAAHDYLPADPGPLSTMRVTGIAAVRASSSGAEVGALLNRSATSVPYSAVDGDPGTAWRSGAFGAVGQWLQVDFDQPISPAGVRIAFADGLGDFPTRLRVSTDAGTQDVDVANDAKSQPLPVPTGSTRDLRVTVLAMAGAGRSAGIAELAIPGITPGRTLDVPITGSPDVLAFDVAPGYRSACVPAAAGVACDPAGAAAGEEDGVLDRSFRLATGRGYRIAATIRLRPSAALTGALDRLSPLTARASSVSASDPRVRPGAAVDGDPGTSWIAGPGDRQPTLTVGLPAEQRITGVQLDTSASAPVSRPLRVRVQAGTLTWAGPLPDSGLIRFGSAVRTRSISVTVLGSAPRASIDAVSQAVQLLPVGISEVRPLGGGAEPAAGGSFQIGCGAGLALSVDGRSVPLQANVPVSAALSGEPVLAVPCGTDLVQLAAGSHRLRLAATSAVAPVSITGTAAGVLPLPAAAPPAGLTAKVLSYGSTRRRIEVHADQPAYLVVRENANAGWHASLNGHPLRPVLLDGWQQGYLIPAGSSGTVTLTFAPQRIFTAGLVAGGLAVLLLLGLCWRPDRNRRDPAAPAGTLPAPAMAALVGLAGFALLGVAGLLLAGAVLAAGQLAAGRRAAAGRTWPAWLPLAVLALLGLLGAFFPPGSAHSITGSWLAQLLAGLAVLATASAAIGSTRLAGRPSRSSRRSMPNQDAAATAVAATAVSQNNSPK